MLKRPNHFGKKYIGGRYVYEHRYIIECVIGRMLEYNELVHHNDGDKTNNNPENLKLITRGKHMGYHPRGRKKENKCNCVICGNEMYRTKPHKPLIFCSRECYRKGAHMIPSNKYCSKNNKLPT